METKWSVPSSVLVKDDDLILEFDRESRNLQLDSDAVQATLLKEIQEVVDEKTAVGFVSLNGSLVPHLLAGNGDVLAVPDVQLEVVPATALKPAAPPPRISRCSLTAILRAAESVRVLLDIVRFVCEPARLKKMAFYFDGEFTGAAKEIRAGRKRGGTYCGFAPAVASDSFFFVDPDLEPIGWGGNDHHVDYYVDEIRGYPPDVVLAFHASRVAAQIISLNTLKAAVGAEHSFDGRSVGFRLVDFVPDPWTAIHLAIRDLAVRRDNFRCCPRPGCRQVFEVSRSDKRSCGAAACAKYVTKLRGGEVR